MLSTTFDFGRVIAVTGVSNLCRALMSLRRGRRSLGWPHISENLTKKLRLHCRETRKQDQATLRDRSHALGKAQGFLNSHHSFEVDDHDEWCLYHDPSVKWGPTLLPSLFVFGELAGISFCHEAQPRSLIALINCANNSRRLEDHIGGQRKHPGQEESLLIFAFAYLQAVRWLLLG